MPALRRLLRQLFNATVAPLLALVLVFEEWGWEPLARLMGRLARLPLWAGLERFVARLPPWAALLSFLTPVLLLFPVKLLALYWIGLGHVASGLVLVLLAKVVGTALVARLFALTQPALMRLAWFAHWYPRWKAWKDALVALAKNTLLWRGGQRLARRARRRTRCAWGRWRRAG